MYVVVTLAPVALSHICMELLSTDFDRRRADLSPLVTFEGLGGVRMNSLR